MTHAAALSVAELAVLVGGEVRGDASVAIDGVSTLDDAGPTELSFLGNPRYRKKAVASRAGAILVATADADGLAARTLIVVRDPHAAFAAVVERFRPPRPRPVGIAPTAWVGASASLGAEVSLAPGVYVGDGARLGDRVVVHAGAVVGDGAQVGDDSTIHPNVVIYPGSVIGRRVILHAGVVIGSDGYGFATVDGKHKKIPQVGRAVIEDDVEIGANSTIDRGALGDTVIGRGTKIDNLVMIAHGVKVGEDCLLVAQCGIAGSTVLGHHVTMAGQSGAVGHVNIGAGAVIAGKAVVTADLAPGTGVSGNPARPHREELKRQALEHRLPELLDRLRRLEAAARPADAGVAPPAPAKKSTKPAAKPRRRAGGAK